MRLRTVFSTAVLLGTVVAPLAAVDSWAAPPHRPPRRHLEPPVPVVDCHAADPQCPAVDISGDAPQHLPGFGPSPFRGFADPSLRRDPASGRLWLGYSWAHIQKVPPDTPGGVAGNVAAVAIHLAHSDDGGLTWTFVGVLWRASRETDQGGSGQPGYSSHEVVSLLPLDEDADTTWVAARLRYFVPDAGETFFRRRPSSFQLRVAQASSPELLGGAPEAVLGGAFTAPGWGTHVNLSALAPAVRPCSIWNEPALFANRGTLYLAAVCLVIDPLTGARLTHLEHVALFATDPAGDVRSWEWRHVGTLLTSSDAQGLGGETLTQVDLARAIDGSLLVIASPNDWDESWQADIHHGCRVLELETLDPPRLARRRGGMPRVRAAVLASDLIPFGPGACGYDPHSHTGVILTRRVIDSVAGGLIASLHATGVHP